MAAIMKPLMIVSDALLTKMETILFNEKKIYQIYQIHFYVWSPDQALFFYDFCC